MWGYEATGNYFQTLGIAPQLGRFFTPAEDDCLTGNTLRKPITGFVVVLTGLAALMLLLASVNLAARLLARASDRHREIEE